ncbi:MAG: hypothetical protein QOC89_6048 [Paraburkholderia sp.]|nr:hypothetical protein [Paraburkholderia sp.]
MIARSIRFRPLIAGQIGVQHREKTRHHRGTAGPSGSLLRWTTRARQAMSQLHKRVLTFEQLRAISSTMIASERLESALLSRLVRRLPLSAAARTHDDACGQSLDKARGRKPRSGPTRCEPESFESGHHVRSGLDVSMILFDHVIQILRGAHLRSLRQQSLGDHLAHGPRCEAAYSLSVIVSGGGPSCLMASPAFASQRIGSRLAHLSSYFCPRRLLRGRHRLRDSGNPLPAALLRQRKNDPTASVVRSIQIARPGCSVRLLVPPVPG